MIKCSTGYQVLYTSWSQLVEFRCRGKTIERKEYI